MDKRPPRLPASTERTSHRTSSERHSGHVPEDPFATDTETVTDGDPADVHDDDAGSHHEELPAPQELSAEDGSRGRAWKARRAQQRTERMRKMWDFFEGGNPYTNYWLVLGATLALAGIGLTMVLSSTSVAADGSPFTTATRQAAWAGIGLVGMFVMSLLPTRWLGGIGWTLMIISAILLVLVAFTPLGHTAGGSTNWLSIGPVRGQPSELAKLALVLWGAAVLSRKGHLVAYPSHWVLPFVAPGALSVLVLVIAGGDLGTAIIIIVIVGAMLFATGIAMRWFVGAAAGALGAVLALMYFEPYRMMRVYAWLGTNCDDLVNEPCYQTQQGLFALASGGFWGVGLGQSRQKWSYIPEVENDFIFTIIGEELGLLGALLVLGLFAVLVLGIYRIAAAAPDRFSKLSCFGIIAWLVGQAFINIAMVTNLIPVVGVPLPFISTGGSALTCALIAIGVVLNFARRQRLEAARGESAEERSEPTTLAQLKPSAHV